VKNLFSFTSPPNSFNDISGSPDIAAPNAIPTNSKNYIKNDSIKSTASSNLINVVNDFQWTTSQKTSRQDVPLIQLIEKRLKINSLLAQLAYYGRIANDYGGSITGDNTNQLSRLLAGNGSNGNVNDAIVNNNFQGLGESISGNTANFGNGLFGSSYGNNLNNTSANNFIGKLASDLISGDVLAAYDGLYITEPTGNEYVFPYFEDIPNAVSNAFEDDDQILSKGYGVPALLGFAADKAEKLAYGLAGTVNVFEPGVFIEKPKFYRFASSGDELVFNFPLINTGWSTFEDVQKNWQLLYMLIYQNRPKRKTRELIDPPSIYEVLIPGVKYIPFAYISRLVVRFMGARRSYKINTPGAGKIDTIIPDAYMVTIILKGLVGETQNFLYHMLNAKSGLINVNMDTDNRTN
jgi:hypothetical protein